MYITTFRDHTYATTVLKSDGVHSFLPESAGTVRMMSESPGSMMERVLTRKYLPQAVPSDTLSPL